MKRVLALVLTVALFACLLCTPAAAAQSKENLVEAAAASDEAKENVVVAPSKEEDIKKAEVTEALADLLKSEDKAVVEEIEKAFEDAGLDAKSAKISSVLSQKEVTVKDEAKDTTIKVGVDLKPVNGEKITIAVFLKTVGADNKPEYKLLGVGEPPLEVEVQTSGTLVTVLVK